MKEIDKGSLELSTCKNCRIFENSRESPAFFITLVPISRYGWSNGFKELVFACFFVRGRGGIPNLAPYVLRHLHNPLQTARRGLGSRLPKFSPMLAHFRRDLFKVVSCIRFNIVHYRNYDLFMVIGFLLA